LLLLSGSGKFGTPWERMQLAKATSVPICVEVVGGLEEEVLVWVAVEPSCAT
jgi:hypothetical protein